MAVEPFWYHFWTFNIFKLFEGFYCWNHCFFHHCFWKNHQVSVGRRRLFHQEIFDPFSEGEIALKFPKFENSWFAHNSLNNGRRAVLIPFLDFQYFWTFWGFLLLKSLFFIIFFEKITTFLRGGDGFSIKKFSTRFSRGKSLLNFLNLKMFNLLITP